MFKLQGPNKRQCLMVNQARQAEMWEDNVLMPTKQESMVSLTENANEAMGVLSDEMKSVFHLYDMDARELL